MNLQGPFMYRQFCSVIAIALVVTASAHAGLYYSGEQYASLPTQWRGFLLDHRSLRNIAVKPKIESEASPLRTRYRQEAEKLQARADKQQLGPDDLADLGALYVRLGDSARAIELLRPVQRAHPNHFALAANLGASWQLHGDYRQAAAALEEAVRLAPGKFLPFEEAHLKLVRSRQRSKVGELDDLFGIRFVNDKDAYEPGKLAAAQRKKLPAKAVAVAQQLALWLPADGPLLWQLAELANAHGDFRSSAAMMEGCVVTFGMQNPTLRKHRLILRDAVENLPKAKVGANEEHGERHMGSIAFRSRRPLISKLETTQLPAIDATGVNPIPWELFGETVLEKPFRPHFPKYLRELEGKQISMTGFMVPLREDPEMTAFLFIEAPVGCWYCEMPETTGIVYVEMPAGKSTRYQRGLVRLVGRLKLNTNDPEEFLYTVKDARVGPID
jgi:tetratricopeptide (TPR) repeat protein